MQFKGMDIITDTQGYLMNPKVWNEEIAEEIARLEGIHLSEDHWQVIYFLRKFYLQYNTSPTIRLLIKVIAQTSGTKTINSHHLFRLFPKGPARQATKIAGLPKPVKCL